MKLLERLGQFAAFVFDFDGTLVDTSKAWENVDRQFFAAHGIPYNFEEYFELIYGKTLEYVAYATKQHYGLYESAEHLLEQYNQIYEAEFQDNMELVPCVQEFLEWLIENGKPIGIATSNPARFVTAFFARYYRILANIAAIVSCEDVGKNKPCPDVYLECLRRLNIAPSAAVVFEDSLSGVSGAKEAGVFVVGVSSFDTKNIVEKQAICDLWINSWEELLY